MGVFGRKWVWGFFRWKQIPPPTPPKNPTKKKTLKKVCWPQRYFELFFFSETILTFFHLLQTRADSKLLASDQLFSQKNNQVSYTDCISWKPISFVELSAGRISDCRWKLRSDWKIASWLWLLWDMWKKTWICTENLGVRELCGTGAGPWDKWAPVTRGRAAILWSTHVYLLRQSGPALWGWIHSLPDVQQSCGKPDYKSRTLLDLQYNPEAVPPVLRGEDLRLA